MIVTSMQLTLSSRRDIAVLQKESSSLEGEEDVKVSTPICLPAERPMSDRLPEIQHIVLLMLENRSFDHMLGLLYAAEGNVSPGGQPFEGLTGSESNPDSTGKAVKAFPIPAGTALTYFMPGADPGEGYTATNAQLFGAEHPSTAA